MKVYYCDFCGNLLFFESVLCLQCKHALGFLPDLRRLAPLESAEQGQWTALLPDKSQRFYRSCANGAQHQVCNWLVPVEDPEPRCVSCRLNATIPDLTVAGQRELWAKLEQAKRRVIYTLLRLDLPLDGVPDENRPALQFRFLADVPGDAPVLTGHANGIITLNVAEADDVERERRRVSLNEPFRTLLGHFRHEVAHYYWDRLIMNSPWLPAFREKFGDETQDYGDALQQYYQKGPPTDWQSRFVSAYASAHPWEDWAETWAHYLHMIDALETAASVGMKLRPKSPAAATMASDPERAAAHLESFEEVLSNWMPLTCALNELNRSMGHADLYPFVLSTPAMEKLRFVADVIVGSRLKPVPIPEDQPAST